MIPRRAASAGGAVASLLCASALAPLFDGFWWWFGPVLVVTIVSMSVSAVSRALRLPLAAGVLLGMLGAMITVTALCARDTAIAAVVPTRRTVSALHTLLAAGRDDISRLAVPVPQRPGLTVLTVIGVYFVVMAVDFLVVTIRRPTLAGLPLLALFAVPAAVLPHGVGPVPFVLGALGFLLLLLLDGQESVERWGKPITDTGYSSPRNIPGTLGGAIAVCAVVCAVAVPVVLPSPDGSGLVGRGHGGDSTSDGPNSAIVLPPFVSMSQQLHASQTIGLLSVRTATPQYLRLTALEQFDGQRFTLRPLRAVGEARVSNGLPPPNRNARTTAVSATIDVSKSLVERYLPLPGSPTKINNLDGDWRLSAETGTVFSTRTSTAGASYQVEASVPDPLPDQLMASPQTVPADLKIDTELPTTTDPRIQTLARTLTRTSTNAYRQALAIQDYLRSGNFTYDLGGAPTTQDGALAEFLFATRRGYCEQFASAMTVLLRELGIPARVAIGFVPGSRQADGTYLITNKEAHAWPEVWFASTGWIRFEPTPRGDGGTATPSYVPATTPPGQSPQSTATDPSAVPTPAPTAIPSSGTSGDDGPQPQPDMAARTRPAAGSLLWILACVLAGMIAVTLLLAPAMVRLTRRRHRLTTAAAGSSSDGNDATSVAARVHAAWAELTDLATDLRLPLRPAESPRASATRLAAYIAAGPEIQEQDAEAGGAALTRIAAAEELARYAPPPLTRSGVSEERLGHDLLTVTRLLRMAAPRGNRTLAAVAPRSVVSGFRGLGGLGGLARPGTNRLRDRRRSVQRVRGDLVRGDLVGTARQDPADN
ncbi:transglutaminaseTgpA domain-containing protein [Frankia sp. Cppng1_Ct_nod]|uniref:transglutaminaseTgpA domain-containing protein n=1 Tax=Frankia sp. Cppng1_Ct_nod TaxID=2897162 RepID=UPI0020258A86|nr:transglutaminaseTgpA domain-containing protein [Frankia sp. Cppng1_Ct_nod]